MWLICDKNVANSHWTTQTNSWTPLDILRAWKLGYRRIRISRRPMPIITR